MAATTIQIWIGSEAQRLVSTAVPNLRDIIITDERNIYVGDGVSPLLALIRSFDPPGTAAALFATANSAIQAVASRPTAPPRQTSYSIRGGWALGYASNGPIVNLGYDVGGVRARIDEPPQGQPAVLQLIDGATATVLYTMTIPVGQTLVDDLAASFHLNDGAQLRVNFTAIGSTFPGRGLQLELVASTTGTTGVSIGAASNLQPSSVGASSLTLTWDYSGGDTPDHYEIRWKAGASPPTSLSDGTAGPDASGSATSQKVSGLTSGGFYSFAVTPVASDGTPGTPATLSNVQTAALDTTPPGPVSSIKWTASQGTVTFTWAWPTDPDVQQVIIRRKNNSTVTAWATLTAGQRPSEGKPAGGGLNATGDGYVFDVTGGNSFTDTGLNASTSYVYGFWTVDASGNINPVAVSAQTATTAAPVGLQGDNAVILSTFQLISVDAATGTATDNFNWFQGFAHGDQGPSDSANVDLITDPDLGAPAKCFRLQMRRYKGWADSTTSVYKNNKGFFYINGGGYQTDGTGWYGTRGQANWPSQNSGALEVTWKIAKNDGSPATALGYATKGLTFMWFPDTGWPRDELDMIELFSAAELQANMHFLNSSGGNGQIFAGHGGSQPFSVFSWITSTLLWEPPPAGTGGTGGLGRMRLWHKQTGVNGGAPLIWFDTDKPYVSSAGSATDDKVTRLLSQAQPGHVGIAVAYNPGTNTVAANGDVSGSNFSCGTGTSGNTRTGHAALLRKVSWWKAN
jgi:hypothetical protein